MAAQMGTKRDSARRPENITGEPGMASKSALLTCAAWGALMIPDAPSAAQTTEQPSAGSPIGIEEVVVTARRREEKAQSVPIVMDTLDQKAIQEQDIRQAQDLSHDIPGLTVQTSLRGAGGSVWIRGIP